MALNFPNSPTDGELYTDTTSGNRWVWDNANTVWKSTSTFTQTITVSSTQPGSPVVGQLWWSQDYGRLFVYYNDGNSSQWVEANPADQTAGLVFNTANAAYGRANTALQNTSSTFAGDLTVSGNIDVPISGKANSVIGLRITGNTTSSLTVPSVRAIGFNPSYELINKDLTQNWYFGINDDDSKALYIGRGYGPKQGVTPAIKVDISDRVIMPSQPAFYVYPSASTSYTNGQIIQFNTATENQGSHFNTSTGRFTAPVTGRYLFTFFTITSNDTAQCDVRVYINGTNLEIYGGYAGVQTGHKQLTSVWLIKLNATDYIDIRSLNTSYVYAVPHTGFSGHLIG